MPRPTAVPRFLSRALAALLILCAFSARGSERDALIRASMTHIDDDTPRLVLADWLTEHGEAEYGEFIRVGCALARADQSKPSYRKLASRRDALIRKHEEKFLPEGVLEELQRLRIRYHWQRGFPEVITDGRDFSVLVEILARIPTLASLTLESVGSRRISQIAATLLMNSSLAKTLPKLEFRNFYALSRDYFRLNAFPALQSLVIEAQRSAMDFLDPNFQVGSSPSALRRLSIVVRGRRAIELSQEEVNRLFSAPELGNLEALDLRQATSLLKVPPGAVQPKLNYLAMNLNSFSTAMSLMTSKVLPQLREFEGRCASRGMLALGPREPKRLIDQLLLVAPKHLVLFSHNWNFTSNEIDQLLETNRKSDCASTVSAFGATQR